MKLNSVDNVIERSGDLQDEENFTIALTAKAIEVLSSQIYKDAQLAIVRELGTNAADSHIEAGKRDVPFDVTLPNAMTPELVIRDYGTGMAYEKVMTMYRTYFGSDKTNSNEVTGCLGLGSKSPLAYTDQFQVTSWYGGEKSVYTVYKNEKGLPCINRIFHTASDEPTGVEVRISIKRVDFEAFRSRAIDTYKWFATRPNVGGIAQLDWKDEAIAFGTDKWKLRKDVQKKLTVVMGNVAYHVEQGDLQSIVQKLSSKARTICECGPILYVNIGDVDIAASRETLKFDGSKTLSTLKTLLNQMADEVVKKFEEQVAACPSHWEARKLLRKLKNTQPLGTILPDKAKWKDKEVSTQIKLNKHEVIQNSIGLNRTVITEEYAECRKYYMRQHRRGYGYSVSTMQVTTIDAEEKANIFIVEGKNHISRVGHFVRGSLIRSTGDANVAYVLTPAKGRDPTLAKDGSIDDPGCKAFTLDHLFKKEFLEGVVKKTSDLPDPPRNVSGGRNAVSHILTPLRHPRHGQSSHWDEKEVDFEKGGVYVEVKGNYWSAGTMSERSAKQLYEYEPVIKGQDIVGIRHKLIEDYEAAPQWVRLDQHVIKRYKDNKEARAAACRKKLWERIQSNHYSFPMTWQLEGFKHNIPETLFGKLVDFLNDLEKDSKSVLASEYDAALPFLNTPLDINGSSAEYAEFTRMYKSFEQRYPLLSLLKDWDKTQDILNYVGLIEGVKLHKKKRRSKRRSTLPELAGV